MYCANLKAFESKGVAISHYAGTAHLSQDRGDPGQEPSALAK